MHGKLDAAERVDMVRRFQDEEADSEEIDRSGEAEGSTAHKGPLRYMVGTYKILGKGLTCTRAFRCYMMDPEWTRRDKA